MKTLETATGCEYVLVGDCPEDLKGYKYSDYGSQGEKEFNDAWTAASMNYFLSDHKETHDAYNEVLSETFENFLRFDKAKCLLGTKRIDPKKAKKDIERGKPRGAPGAATLLQDTVLTIDDPGIVTGKKVTYTVQIKANDSTKFSNLKWEPTIVGRGAARLGKATVELVLDLMRVYGILRYYEPDNKKYPRNKTEFAKVENDYKMMLDEIISDRFVDVGSGVDTTTAIVNIKEAFDLYRGQPWVAVSKLQQIQFLYALLTLPDKKKNEFCTSLIFTAEKAGKRYGPYGKIY